MSFHFFSLRIQFVTVMSNHFHRLPEPTLAENELIRAADMLPELSSGLRSSTMVLCQTQVARAQRARRIKVATAMVLIASVAVAVFALVTLPSAVDNQPIAEEFGGVPEVGSEPLVTTPLPVSPGESSGTSSTFAVGIPGNKNEP
jgi:hypothetical protein